MVITINNVVLYAGKLPKVNLKHFSPSPKKKKELAMWCDGGVSYLYLSNHSTMYTYIMVSQYIL